MIDPNNKPNWTNMRNPTQQTNWFPSPDELDWDDDEEVTQKIVPNVAPKITWKEAYEANKTGNYCVLCGKELEKKQVLSTTINYCSCIEELMDK